MKLVLTEEKGDISFIILNNPKNKNALSLDLMNQFQKILDEFKEKNETKVLIIKGNGSSFCAGHDIKELVAKNKNLDYFKNIFYTCTNLMKTIKEMPQIVISQVHGAAYAAGCQLVANCDLAVAGENAKFCTPGVKIGLFCSTPMVPLSRVIGRRNAFEMLFTGRVVYADEAKKIGLINKVVKDDQLDIETEKYALDISQYSKYTLNLGKKAFYEQINMDDFSAYDYAKDVISYNCLSYDAQEGMKAFLDKRKPNFKGK